MLNFSPSWRTVEICSKRGIFMRLAIIGQQAFGVSVLEAFLKRGDEVAGACSAHRKRTAREAGPLKDWPHRSEGSPTVPVSVAEKRCGEGRAARTRR